MTSYDIYDKKKGHIKNIRSIILSIAFTAFIFVSANFLSDELSLYVAEGLLLAIKVIIPSVFPFLILTDFSMRFIRFERIELLRNTFERIFKVNGCALPVFICGIICGFPVGARLSLMLYENKKISRDECERLMSFSNNASPGYVICAVGAGMRGSLRDGIILYLAMVISSIICGALSGIKKEKSNLSSEIYWQKYNFVNSTRDAAMVCFNIAGFVTVFSMLSGLLRKFVSNEYLFASLIPILEIGNAAMYLSDLKILPDLLALALTSFSISFSGLCVAAQTAALVNKSENLKLHKYISLKLLQGVISAVLVVLFSFIK